MKSKLIIKYFLLHTLFVGGVLFESNGMHPQTVSAQGIVLEGGRAIFTEFCSCNTCFKIHVGPPKEGWFMYCPWYTRLYEHYNVFPDAWQLGKADAWIPCLQVGPWGCFTDGGGFLLRMTGTSMGT